MSAVRRKLRWWQWLLLGLGSLVALVVVLVLAVLWIPEVSRFAIEQGLRRWDATMPARVEWRSIGGSIGRGLEIEGFALLDGDDQPLVRVEHVELEIELLPLLTGTARVEQLAFEGVDIWLEHRWADLSDPNAPESPPTPGIGPDLPLEIVGTLELDEGRVWSEDGEFVGLETLTIDAWGEGREATAALVVAGLELAEQDLGVEGLAVQAHWNSPVATIERFALSAPLAEVERLTGTYDFEAQTGSLILAIEGQVDALADRFELEPLRAADHARLELHAEGGPGGLEAIVELGLGAAGELRVHARGVPTGPVAQRWAAAEIDGRIGAGMLGDADSQGPVLLDLSARVRGRADDDDDAAGFVAALEGRLHDVRSDERLALGVAATADGVDPLTGHASVGLHGAGLEFDASVEHPDAASLEGRWSLRSAALERPLTLAARLLDVPELAEVRGALAAEGRCSTRDEGELASLRCPVKLELARASGRASGWGAAVERAELDGYVDPLAEPLTLAANLDVDGLRVDGAADGREAFVFDELELAARGSLERLRIEAAGHGEHERFDLAGAVELGDERVAVGLERLELVSDRGGPRTRVALLQPTRVTIADQVVDIDALSLAAAGGRLDVDGRLELDPTRGRSDLRFNIDAVELARLNPFIPGLVVDGELSLRGAFNGWMRDPDAWVLAQAEGLRVGDFQPGTLGIVALLGQPELPAGVAAPIVKPALAGLTKHGASDEAPNFAGEGLRVWAYSAGPMARRINLAAAVPLTLADGVGLEPGGDVAVRVAVERFDLTVLGGLMPDTPAWWSQVPGDAAAPPGDPKLMPEGYVDLDLAVTGTAKAPRIATLVRARELAIDRTELGSLLLRGSYDESGAWIDLDAKPGFAQIELRAQLPMNLDLARGELDWATEVETQLVSLDIRALDLDALQTTLGPKLPELGEALDQAEVSGLVAVSVRGSGSLETPQLGLAVRGAGLRYRGESLGQLRMLAGYSPGRAEAELHLDSPLAQRLDARVVVPVEYRFGAKDPLQLDTDAPLIAELHIAKLSIFAAERYLGPLPIAGEANLDLEVNGSFADPDAELLARVDGLVMSGEPVGDVLARATFDDGHAVLDLDLLRAGEHILAAALAVPLAVEITPNLRDSKLAWDREGSHRIYVTGRGINDEVLTALFGRGFGPPPGSFVAGSGGRETQLFFDIAGGGRLSDFSLAGQLGGELGVDDELGLTLAANFEFDEADQRLEFSIEPSAGQGLAAAVELGAAVPKLVRGEQAVGEIPLDIDLAAPNFNLHCIAGLLPAELVDPQGYLRVQVSGSGTIDAPDLRGALMLDDAAITILALRQRLTEIDLGLDFEQDRLELRSLSATAGRGSLTGQGHAQRTPGAGIFAELDLTIAEFPLVRPGLPGMAVDSKVGLELRRWTDGTKVDVVLADTEVVVAGINEAPPKPIPTSPHVIFVSADADLLPRERSEAAEPVEAAADDERFTLTLDLADPLLITGASIDMAWAGALELEVESGVVAVGGQLDSRRGRLRLFGNSFDLRRGVVTLPDDGTLDPYLDLEAVASTAEAEVTVTVRGRVSRPALAFSSTPPLSEYEILALLVTGSTEVGAGDSEVSAEAASLLAAVSNPQLQAQLNRYLGIDRAELGFGETVDQPILTVGKRITRNVYVETTYHHNAPEDENTAEVGVEYNIVPHLTAESFFGDASVGGFGLYWTRSFAAPAWGARFGRNGESANDDDE